MGGCVKREIGFEVLDNRIPIKIEDVMDVKETPDGEFADKESVLDDEKDIKPNDDLLNKLRTKRRVKIPPNDDDVIKDLNYDGDNDVNEDEKNFPTDDDLMKLRNNKFKEDDDSDDSDDPRKKADKERQTAIERDTANKREIERQRARQRQLEKENKDSDDIDEEEEVSIHDLDIGSLRISTNKKFGRRTFLSEFPRDSDNNKVVLRDIRGEEVNDPLDLELH